MTDSVSDEINGKVDKVIDSLIKCKTSYTPLTLDNLTKDKLEEREEVNETLKLIILSRDKTGIKKHIKKLIEILKKLNVPFVDENSYNQKDKSKPKAPVLWSNGMPNNVLVGDGSNKYNLKINYYDDRGSLVFRILWSIIKEAIMRTGELNIDNTYCQELFKECNGDIIIENGKTKEVVLKKHVPYDKFLSELWVEEIPLDIILRNEIRLEFGQNDSYIRRRDKTLIKRDKDKVYFATDSVMSMSELPILLDRIAKYNIEMELAGTPEKKIYLENVGVSIDEVISGNYKTISERYGEGKDNENAGYVILKKIERSGPHGDASKESIMVPIKLKLMILKLEEQRLTEIEEELDSLKEKIVKEWIMTNGKISRMLMEKNSSLKNSFVSEEQQNNFIEEIKREQEIAYLNDKDFIQSQIELVERDTDNSKYSIYDYASSDDEIEISDNEEIEKIKERKEKLLENREIQRQKKEQREKEEKEKLSLIDKSEEEDFIRSTTSYQDERIRMGEIKVKNHIEALRNEIKEIRRQSSVIEEEKTSSLGGKLIRAQRELGNQLENLLYNLNI